MKTMRLVAYTVALLFLCKDVSAQSDDSLLTRLHAIANNGVDYYNVMV